LLPTAATLTASKGQLLKGNYAGTKRPDVMARKTLRFNNVDSFGGYLCPFVTSQTEVAVLPWKVARAHVQLCRRPKKSKTIVVTVVENLFQDHIIASDKIMMDEGLFT